MTAHLIDGKLIAKQVRQHVTSYVESLTQAGKRQPGLAVVLVGSDAASQVYVSNKRKACEEVGFVSRSFDLPSDTTEETLLNLVDELNEDKEIDGILVQLPLPAGLNAEKVLERIHPHKDVDGFHLFNVGKLATGAPGLIPCTPLGCLMLIKDSLGSDLSGKRALVLGRSNIVGKPMASLLLRENCTVTIAHSRTQDLAAECARADILVAATGRPRMVKKDWVKKGAIVIDVGINRLPPDEEGKSKLVGDVDYDNVKLVAGALTPVPGGVGPMTIACLLQNTLTAACAQNGVELVLG